MIEKYSYYKFEVFHSSGVLPLDIPEHWSGWVYKIHNDDTYGGDIESDEWFETEQEARLAVVAHIDKLEDGDCEPDYDAPTAAEMYQRAHDDRQKLRGY